MLPLKNLASEREGRLRSYREKNIEQYGNGIRDP